MRLVLAKDVPVAADQLGANGGGDVAQSHGAGLLAHGGVFELQVGGPTPVVVDPQAFVASYGPVRTELKSSMSWRNVGRTGGEAMQLECSGQGIVYVQASEEKL